MIITIINELEACAYSQLSSPDNPLDAGTDSMTVVKLVESIHPVCIITKFIGSGVYTFYE